MANSFFLKSDIDAVMRDGRHKLRCPACSKRTLGKIKTKETIAEVRIGCTRCGFPGDFPLSFTEHIEIQAERYRNTLKNKITLLEMDILNSIREIGKQRDLLRKTDLR